MTRFIGLSCGGEIAIHCGERCPECNAHPKAVESVEFGEGGYPVYTCSECGIDWEAYSEPSMHSQ